MKEIGDVLKVVLEGFEKGGNPLTIDWSFITGPELSQHSRLIDVDPNSLTIEVSHSGWKQLLMTEKTSILERLHKYYPDYSGIKRINIKIKDDRNNVSSKIKPKKEETTEEKIDLTESINQISNAEFREYLKKLHKRKDPDC